MTAKQVIKIIEADGWRLDRQKGSHMTFKHPLKNGNVTVPYHANRDLKRGTLNGILKQAGLK